MRIGSGLRTDRSRAALGILAGNLLLAACMLPIPHQRRAPSELRPQTAVRVTFPARDLVAVRRNGDTLQLRSVYEVYAQVVEVSSTDVFMEISSARHSRGVVHAPLGTRLTIPIEDGVQYIALTPGSGFVEFLSFAIPTLIAFWIFNRMSGADT